MKITYKGDYALKVVLDLSLHYGSGVVTLHDLADRLDIPIKFLEQILLELKRGNFVESRRGKIGGYFLGRSASEIRVGEVVRFIDGPIEAIACVEERYGGCGDVYKCVFRKVWQDVASATSGIVDNLTFEDLANQVRKQKERLVYQI